MRSILIISVLFNILNATYYEEGKNYFAQKSYNSALNAFKKSYEKESNSKSAFYIATIYEDGLGVKQDSEKAFHWYKLSATIAQSSAKFYDTQENYNKDREAFYKPVSKNKEETLYTLATGKFGFKAYKENYFLPFSYNPTSYYPNHENIESKPVESQFQISLQTDVAKNIFKLGEVYTLAYTQRSFWQTYATSAYFRESNYEPEVFVTVPMVKYDLYNLDYIRIGFTHQSNGQGGYQERSWNRLITKFLFQNGSFFTDLTLWARVDGFDKSYPEGKNYNPDILDYLGYGHLRLSYIHNKSLFRTKFTYGVKKSVGSVEATWSYPLFDVNNMYWYTQLFSGYGESLIDYNHNVNKVSIGVSFSR